MIAGPVFSRPMPRRLILPAAAAAAVLVVAVIVWLVVLSTRTVSLTADGVEVRFDSSAFEAGADPALSAAAVVDDEFVEVFGLPGPGPDVLVASLRAASDPVAPVEITFDVFLDALPDDAAPAVFHRDDPTGRWLPVPSVIDDGRVVGTADRAGDYVAGVLTAVPEVWRGVQWLRFQVGIEPPVVPFCTEEAPPWVLGVTVDDDGTIGACAESGDDAELVLRLAPRRPYALMLAGPPVDGPGTAIPGAESVLSWPVGELPAGTVTVAATPTAESALHDTVRAGAAVLTDMTTGGSDLDRELDGCLRDAGADTDAAVGCLDPFVETGGPPAERVVSGIRTGATIETAGRPAPAAAAALQSPGEVVLDLAAVMEPPPDGATVLHEALVGWQIGQSGNRVAVLINDVFAPLSTTQWVGCEETPAAAYYAIDGQTRFTGVLGPRDYMPDDIVAQVRLLVDDTVVTEFEAGVEPVDVDVELPPGDVLLIEAHRIAGECGPAPDGYLVWGNGALSGR
jgi:hypothetical protein